MKKRLSRTLKETLFLEEGFFARLEDLPNQIAQGHQQQARAEEELRAELAQLKDTLQEERETWQRTARELNERAQAQTEAMRQELLHAIDELRETTNLIARRITLRPNKIKCLMLVHHIEAWDSLAGVHAAMQESPDFQVTVASIPRRFPGAIHFENEDQIDARLTALGVEHIRLGFEDDAVSLGIVKAINPDIIFRQSQWDDDVQPAFATASLSFARLCFVPYEAMNLVQNVQTDENVIDSATDTVFHRACWMIFCANEQARQQAVAHGALSGEQFHATGHPKGDRLRTAKPSWPIKARGRPRPLRIIWSAHHSIDDDWTRFGLFPRIAQDMLGWARTRTDVDIVFSPHPALLTQLQNDSPYMPHRQSEAFFSDWNALPNTAIFTGGHYGPLFQASDLLMTDGVSWLVEYQLANKPLLFLERDGHVAFNEIGERVLQGVHRVTSIDQAMQLADAIGNPDYEDPLAGTQQQIVDELFGRPQASRRILDAIRAKVREELGLNPKRLEPRGSEWPIA